VMKDIHHNGPDGDTRPLKTRTSPTDSGVTGDMRMENFWHAVYCILLTLHRQEIIGLALPVATGSQSSAIRP
jgi:hypothetical protein